MDKQTELSPLLSRSGQENNSYDANRGTVVISDGVTDCPRHSDVLTPPAAALPENGAIVVAIDHESGSEEDSSSSEEDQAVVQSGNNTMHDAKAVMSAIKGNIGTGILAIPFAVKCAGIVVGPLLTFVLGVVATACMHLLVRARHIQVQRARDEGYEVTDMGYAELFAASLRTYSERFRGHPEVWAKRFVNALLLISQLGFCSVYIVFIADNISEFVHTLAPAHALEMWQYQMCVAAFLAPYCQLRGINKVSPIQMCGNILTAIGLTLIFLSCGRGVLTSPTSKLPAFAGWTDMPVFFGTVAFSFEGISLLLPIEKKVKDKRLYSAPFGVITLSLAVVVCLYTIMGFFGYLQYGPDTKASITLNLPTDQWYYLVVKPIYAAVIFISYQLQLHVPVQLVQEWLKTRYHWHGTDPAIVRRRHWVEALVRFCFFLLTLVIAMSVPRLDILISFVGAFASSFLAFILPALIYLLTQLSQPQRPRGLHAAMALGLPVFVILLGLLGFVIGTYTSIMNIIN